MMLPLVAPIGTGTTIVVSLQLEGVATTPPKLTMLEPWPARTFAPVVVMTAPVRPLAGATAPTEGARTVNTPPWLAAPPTVTTTGPVVASIGTWVLMLVALQLLGTAGTPLKVAVLDPCVVPKLAPEMVTVVAGAPYTG